MSLANDGSRGTSTAETPADRTGEPLYISVHIPKTAGTTFGRFLKAVFGSRFQSAYLETPETPRLENPACLHGHDVLSMFGGDIAAHRNSRWLVFVREPLDLAVSLYFHTRQSLPAAKFVDRGLVDWLTRTEEYRWPDPPCYPHNHYRHQWARDCGRPLELFDFVGITEQFDESIMLMCDSLGWTPQPYGRDNVGSYRVPPLAGEVVTRFKQLNDSDYEIYERCLQTFARRKAAYGECFHRDLEAFRRMFLLR